MYDFFIVVLYFSFARNNLINEFKSYLTLRVRPEPPKSAGMYRNVLPLVNVPLCTYDRRLLVVFLHFAAFRIIFSPFSAFLKKLENPESSGFPKFLEIWENVGKPVRRREIMNEEET